MLPFVSGSEVRVSKNTTDLQHLINFLNEFLLKLVSFLFQSIYYLEVRIAVATFNVDNNVNFASGQFFQLRKLFRFSLYNFSIPINSR